MMRGLKKILRQYATLIELLVRMVNYYVALFHIYNSDVCIIISNGLMHSQSAVQNKHMFVYNPDSGRSVVINASLVDVS